MGVTIGYVTLHVGLGTFRPVQVERIESHQMHPELAMIPPKTAKIIGETRLNGGKVVAVGTTSARTLESFAVPGGLVQAGNKWTDIFLYPGYKFQVVDSLVTNFHLPESSLIMLVSALAGREQVLSAYHEAIAQEYRFFSFGDAMIIT